MNRQRSPSIRETFGLQDLSQALREATLSFRGDPLTPPARFGLSSLKVLKPGLSLRTWLRRRRPDRRIVVYNLFNHRQTDIRDGWSVRTTQVEDYRGKSLTYDSHNGTDFVVPVGTKVVAPAPGRVVRVSSEFNRGGLKLLIDHGSGLITTANHLSRVTVRLGQDLKRGEPMALSGASGIDMLLLFPWNVPHVHFNVWLNGEPVDPFARLGETSLWRDHNRPGPARRIAGESLSTETLWNIEAVRQAIAGCRDAELRETLASEKQPAQQAANTLFHLNYYPQRFSSRPLLYAELFPRRPLLDLPFSEEDCSGLFLAD